MIGRQHATRLQDERANRLIRPEHVGLRALLFRQQPVGQSRGLGLFRVVDDVDPNARSPFVLLQDRLGERPIGGHVGGDLARRTARGAAAGRRDQREQRRRRDASAHEAHRPAISSHT